VRIVTIVASLSICCAAAACGGGGPAAPSPTAVSTLLATVSSPTEAVLTPIPTATLGAGEVVKLSGDTFTTSDPFHIDSDIVLEIAWNYTGSGPFALWLVNVSEEVTDPQYDRMLIVDVDGPPAGSAQQAVIAGDYAVQVEQADGPWTVEIKVAP
jgi:hypothetical protein